MKIKNIIWMLVFICLAFSSFAQIYPTSYSIVRGTYVSGSVDCLSVLGSSCLVIEETAQAPAFDVRFNFTNITNIERADLAFIHSAGSDELDFEIWDYEFMLWQDLEELIISTEYTVLSQPIEGDDDKFIQNGVVTLRLVHDVSGNPSHSFDIYSVSLHPEDSGESCPVTEIQWKNTVLLLFVICLIIGFGMVIEQMLFCVLGSIALMLWSLKIIGCDQTIGSILFVCSLVLGLYFGFREKEN